MEPQLPHVYFLLQVLIIDKKEYPIKLTGFSVNTASATARYNVVAPEAMPVSLLPETAAQLRIGNSPSIAVSAMHPGELMVPKAYASTVAKAFAAEIDLQFSVSSVPGVPGTKNHPKRIRLKAEAIDILAIGALILMTGAAFAALLTVLFMGLGTIEPEVGMKIILGCVGGGAVAAVVGKFSLGGRR